MITDELIAEWESERGNGLTSAIGEYTPEEFWRLLDSYKQLRGEYELLKRSHSATPSITPRT